MPLNRGFSRRTIRGNIETMIAEGKQRNVAIAAAHRQARADFWRVYPQLKPRLPEWIYPERAIYYRPQSIRRNPVKDLDAADVNSGLKLYEKFVGRPADRADMIRRPELPDALVCIGKISVLQYIAERDGREYEFRHPFRKSSRPLLCVTPDGNLVLALGGAWVFAEDGFEDLKP